jgi:hypothetical protein
MRLNVFVAAGILAVCGLSMSTTAIAANINIHDLTDVVTVDATQFDVAAAVITHTNIFGGEDDVRITGQFISNSPDGSSGGNQVDLLEPGTFNGQTYLVSDRIRSTWSVTGRTATLTIEFGSDPPGCDTNPAPCFHSPLVPPNVLEDGTMQSLNGLLSLPANITLNVQSDLDAVPEPASILLVGTGLVAGARRWRNRRQRS